MTQSTMLAVAIVVMMGSGAAAADQRKYEAIVDRGRSPLINRCVPDNSEPNCRSGYRFGQ